ncbi:MAG: ribonuclease PH [Candidatus Omnitrophica bacterium]|nr:ribonuclease PH [Candidatus Omnitrophota bacterium]
MSRIDGRSSSQLRPVKITKNYVKHPAGSCLYESGDTKVLCTASIENTVPPFLKNTETGWVTAEYSMLPGSCASRVKRDKTSGRTLEIQRLIGWSLRSVVDLSQLGEVTIKIDCDVIQADGGTRTASITGGFIALALALSKMKKHGLINTIPLSDYVAAISVGIFENELVLDLNYAEDSKADMDMNVVMVGKGKYVEVQGTAEGSPYSKKQMDDLLKLASAGIKELVDTQKKTLKGIDI